MVPGLAGLVGQTADGGAGRDVGGVGLGEAQGAGGVDVDLLAAGDFNVLIQLLDFGLFVVVMESGTYQGVAASCEDGLVAWWTGVDLGRAVGGG